MHKLVLGLAYGDEGKGLVTDYLCSKSPNPLIIRFNGGHQAGHTVVREGIRHVFSNFGSGTLYGAPTYWSKFCTVEPIGVLNELKVLEHKGRKPKLYIDGNCPITTPYDFHHNRTKTTDGTVGVGFGATIQREEDFYSLTFLDLFYKDVFAAKLKAIDQYYLGKSSVYRDANFYNHLDEFKVACEQLIQVPNIELIRDLKSLYPSNTTLIFEGAQGLLLDQHYGFFPNVTRSNTGSKNVLEIWKQLFNFAPIPEVYLVTRAYQTRHGNGFMSNEELAHNIAINPSETNVKHDYQGDFRRTLLDVSLLEYAIQKDEFLRKSNIKSLVITCLDHIKDNYDFTYQGELKHSLTEEAFIQDIYDILSTQGIRDVYLSRGDEGNQLVKW